MAVNPRVGDIGVVLTATVKDENGVVVDLSTATTKQIKLATPAGVTTAKTASYGTPPGTNGVLTYTTIAGDLSVRGNWRAQPYVVTPTRTFHASIHDLEVEDNL
jgi:hypothetical protein